MLTKSGEVGFVRMLKAGCFLHFLPYRWDMAIGRLTSASKWHMRFFNFNKNILYIYTCYAYTRLIQAWMDGDLPLQQKLLSTLWSNAFLITSVGFLQLQCFPMEILHFTNGILGHIYNAPKPQITSYAFGAEEKAQKYETTVLSWHLYISLFLLSSNPWVHGLIAFQSPCCPHFISSVYFECNTADENVVSLAEKAPFIALELYTVTMFLYVCAFMWCCILMGLAWVASQLGTMGRNFSTQSDNWYPVLLEYRKLELTVGCLNTFFRYYLMAFPSILFFIVSMLIFGTIRLWHVDPQSNVMYPLCGMRCGFEAVTPLAMAGKVFNESRKVMAKWKKVVKDVFRSKGGETKRLMLRIHRSCRAIQCTAGSIYTFEHSIVLCCINNCTQLTFNLLVSFGKNA